MEEMDKERFSLSCISIKIAGLKSATKLLAAMVACGSLVEIDVEIQGTFRANSQYPT